MKNSEITTSIELDLEFKGHGDASDYWFKQLHASNMAYVYEKRGEFGDLHYKSFERKVQLESDVVMQGIKVHRDEKVIYPQSPDFGDWAYCTRDYLKAMAYFEGFNLEGQEKTNKNPQEPPKITNNISNENMENDESERTDSTIITGVYKQLEFKYWEAMISYFIHTKSSDIFSLGCIYESWVDKGTGEIRNTFSILTTPANPLMESIHNLKKRMPLILSREDEKRWIEPNLTSNQINELIKPYPESDITAYTVSQNVNSGKNNRNVPQSQEKDDYPELSSL